jgi:hypothetical protein
MNRLVKMIAVYDDEGESYIYASEFFIPLSIPREVGIHISSAFV